MQRTITVLLLAVLSMALSCAVAGDSTEADAGRGGTPDAPVAGNVDAPTGGTPDAPVGGPIDSSPPPPPDATPVPVFDATVPDALPPGSNIICNDHSDCTLPNECCFTFGQPPGFCVQGIEVGNLCLPN